MEFDESDIRIEVWKKIPKCRGWYEVSTHGRVRSLPRVVRRSNGTIQTFRGRILKQGRTKKKDYPNVVVGRKCREVHRLVAEAFIPNPLGLPEVNHKDGDKGNNHVSNLEWVTRQQNCQHASENGLARGGSMPGETHPSSKLTEVIVRKILCDKATPNYILARRYGVTRALICAIRKRRAWKHVSNA